MTAAADDPSRGQLPRGKTAAEESVVGTGTTAAETFATGSVVALLAVEWTW